MDNRPQLWYYMHSIRVKHKKKYSPVPKRGRNLEWRRKLEQTLENGQYSTTLLPDELYKDHTQKKIFPRTKTCPKFRVVPKVVAEHWKRTIEHNFST